jgi:hypothetical protein
VFCNRTRRGWKEFAGQPAQNSAPGPALPIPSAALVVILNAGHLINLEEPDAFIGISRISSTRSMSGLGPSGIRGRSRHRLSAAGDRM